MDEQIHDFYKTTKEIIAGMKQSKQVKILHAILDYLIDGITPSFGGVIDVTFDALRPLLDCRGVSR
jgi:hypothetical protein